MLTSTDFRVPRIDGPLHFRPYVITYKCDGKESHYLWSCFASDARTAIRTFELMQEGKNVEIISVTQAS